MLRTFLRRWWITNRLYHLTRHHFGNNMPKEDFTAWMVGLDISHHVASWYTGRTRRDKITELITPRLLDLDSKKKRIPDIQIRELNKILEECSECGWINCRDGNHIFVTTTGLEIYSVSYLLFGHEYARKIWTAILAGLVIWYVGWKVERVLPEQPLQVEPIKIQIEYSQSSHHIPSSAV